MLCLVECGEILKRLDEYIEALEQALSNAKWQFEDEEFYEPLIKIGLVREGDIEILFDPYYDAQAVAFALRCLRKVRSR